MNQPVDIEALRQLMERLRVASSRQHIRPFEAKPAMREAADAIEAMTAELEALRAERGRMVEAKNVILARCEALEDEASDGIDTVIANDRDKTHEGGFWRGQKSTAKSIRCHLHDLTRTTLKEPSQ